MAERFITVGDIRLCIDTYGASSDPAVLLIGGSCMSMDWWEPEFCERLAAGGRYVIRYDARDTGRSAVSPAEHPSYTSDELATDPIGVLDALGVDAAHLVGISMGGGIAQQIAPLYADRIRSLTLIATSAAGELDPDVELPGMSVELNAVLADPAPTPPADDRAAWVGYVVAGQRPFSGPQLFDEEHVRQVAGTVVDRTVDLAASFTNHWAVPSGTLPDPTMADIAAPTLVLHGTADPFFQFPHGEALAAAIPDATLISLEGVGHEVPPPPLWDVVVRALLDHTAPVYSRGDGHVPPGR